MKNLYVGPEVHFENHIISGRRLIERVSDRCGRCDGKGWVPPPMKCFVAAGVVIAAPKGVKCGACDGSGRKEN